MNKPLISVIIPIYNVEEYLEKSVDSVRNQTLKNIEIILVDDGSIDQSGTICDRIAAQDERVKVIHKPNGGLSDARNVGATQAQADLIGFVDSDDYVAPTMYQRLYQEMTGERADLAYCGLYHVIDGKEIPDYKVTTGKVLSNRDELVEKALCSDNITLHAWNKLYKKDLILKHPFPVGRTYEDAFFAIPYFLDCQKAVGIMDPLYYYVKREGSIVNSTYSQKDMNVILAHDTNFELLKDNLRFIPGAKYRLYWSRFYVLDKMLQARDFDDHEQKQAIIKYLRHHYLDIMKNPYVKKKRKLVMSALMIHEKLYKLALSRKQG